MATAATIMIELALKDQKFQKGMDQVQNKTVAVSSKLQQLNNHLKNNSASIELLGEGMKKAGQKMTMFTAVPIIGFFGLLIKKARDADTAMSKMAKESTDRMNASLAKLGEKFLPLFIRIVDGLTMMIDKFLAASPATQKFITMLVVLVAMAGPLMTMTGSLISTVSWLGQVGITASSIMPALSALFTFITATAIPAIVAFVAANAAWLAPLLLLAGAAYLVYLAFKNNFGGITTTVENLWGLIKVAFLGIGKAIDWLITKIGTLTLKLLGIDLPKDLKPGSPTPFEEGLMGISKAMDQVSSRAQKMRLAFASIDRKKNIAPGFQKDLDAQVSSSSFEKGLKDIAKAMDEVSSKAQKMGLAFASIDREKDIVLGFQKNLDAQAKGIENGLKAQENFQDNYFQNISKLLEQSTKNHQVAMGLQVQQTQMALKAQATAMQKYIASAASFWSGKNIQTSTNVNVNHAIQSADGGSRNIYYTDNRRIAAGLSAAALREALDLSYRGVANNL